MTLLTLACTNGNAEGASLLLSRGEVVESSALCGAVAGRHADVVRVLLAAGPSRKYIDEAAHLAGCVAEERKLYHCDVLQAFLEAGYLCFYSARAVTAAEADPEVVEAYLNAGGDVNYSHVLGKHKLTLLMLACSSGNLAVARTSLRRGAAADRRASNGNSALRMALTVEPMPKIDGRVVRIQPQQRVAIVRELIEYGAASGDDLGRVLSEAEQRRKRAKVKATMKLESEIVELLVHAKRDKSLLFQAVHAGDGAIVDMYLDSSHWPVDAPRGEDGLF